MIAGITTVWSIVRADPLKWGLVAGIAATGGMLAWHLNVTDPLLRGRITAAEAATRKVEIEHARQVAAANFERAEQSERYRALEADRDKAIADLQAKLKGERDERAKADARAAVAGQLRDAAETRYLAEQARRATEDPAAASRIDGETIAMFRELRRETDGLAEEASGAADDLRDQVIGLQAYVLGACQQP